MNVIKFLSHRVVIASLFAFAVAANAQESVRPAANRITIRVEKQPFGTVVGLLMESYGIRIGFEESALDRQHNEYNIDPYLPQSASRSFQGVTITAQQSFEAKEHPIDLKIKDGTLDDVMKALVAQMSWYEWELRDGVVNIFPKKGRDPRFEKLLDTNVERFEMKKGTPTLSAMFALAELPELKEFLKRNDMGYAPENEGAQILLQVRRKQKFDSDLTYSNLTFRDLLNRITTAKGGGGWKLRVHRYLGGVQDYMDLEL